MQGYRELMDQVDRNMTRAVGLGIGHCDAEDARNDGRHVRIDGRDVLNFTSCSYLGLEIDPRLVEGAVEAVRAHGVQCCASRVYLSSPLYRELETLTERIFEAHVVVSPTTTLGHLSALPTLVDPDDAMILDHHVHTSVQLASRYVSSSGVPMELVRHNDLERLEERVAELSRSRREVWYLADGIYSMSGDAAPVRELVALLDRYPQMRLYVDDAHGMSWRGPRGAGSVLEQIALHPRMVLTTGLGKGFGTGGGLIVLPDDETRRRIRTIGPTMLFGGPLQVPVLGAAVASARIHLSPEIEELQQQLQDRIRFCAERLAEHALPVVSPPDTPVGFVGVSTPDACHALVRALLDEGLFTNPAYFPATPLRRGGLRFLLSRHQTLDDIARLVDGIARHWEPAVRAGGTTPEEVYDAFRMEMPEARRSPRRSASSGLLLETADSIEKLDRREWDALLGDRGCLASSALAPFERVFGGHPDPTIRWDFRYYVIRDGEGRPVLATLFTKALWKADMLSPPDVSRRIEEMRREEPFHLTQQVFASGCLLSEGDQLWLREPADHPTSREALALLLEAVRRDARGLGCEIRVVRDVPVEHEALRTLLEDHGLLAMPAPDSLVLDDVRESEAELVASLSRKHRRHHYGCVRPFDECYVAEVHDSDGPAMDAGLANHLHALYRNVKTRNLGLNTFELPETLLQELAGSPDWEIVTLRPSDADEDALPVGFFASFTGQPAYVPLVAGLDYTHVRERGLYRQLLRHVVQRARDRGQRRVLFGLEASLEKRRMGARPEQSLLFVEADDLYTFDAVAQIAAESS